MKSIGFHAKTWFFGGFCFSPGHLNHFQRICTPLGRRQRQYTTFLIFKISQLEFLSMVFLIFDLETASEPGCEAFNRESIEIYDDTSDCHAI